MLFLLFLIVLAVSIFLLYSYTNTFEPWHNYNYRNSYYNMFGLSPYFRTKHQIYDVNWDSGIHSVPQFNTISNLSEKSRDLYTYHQYLSNIPLTGYQSRRGYSPYFPVTLTSGNRILT